MHPIQKILLKRLLFQNKQKYSTLTAGYGFEENIVFHLKHLISKGFIEKQGSCYTITTKGVEEITSYDLSLLEDTGFKTFFLGFLCESDGEYLTKEHVAGEKKFYNLPSGKPRFGEKIENALTRTFFENTGLSLKPQNFQYFSLHLKTVKTFQNETLFDDAFAIFKVTITNDQKVAMGLKNGVNWYPLKQIKKLPNRWPEIDLCILQDDTSPYFSYQFASDYILE